MKIQCTSRNNKKYASQKWRLTLFEENTAIALRSVRRIKEWKKERK